MYFGDFRIWEEQTTGVSVSAQITVNTTPTLLAAGVSSLKGRKRMRVFNNGTNSIFYAEGTSTVTTSGANCGFPIPVDTFRDFYFDPNIPVDIYAISTAANNAVYVIES